jgi:hypothetical protein
MVRNELANKDYQRAFLGIGDPPYSFIRLVVIFQSNLAVSNYIDKSIPVIALFTGIGAVTRIIIYYFERAHADLKREQKIEAVERRVQENPKETQAAWELARVKLESYLNRNLSQVRSIFWLTVFVMA